MTIQETVFSADASLLAELGERLIGRPNIALGELVKNSFDADATECRIEFTANSITVTDNGNGMSEDQFHEHWLRLGTTHKVDERISPVFKRRLSGSKGIGRLSVQFLAENFVLESHARDHARTKLWAEIDWTKIHRGDDLDSVTVSYERSNSTGSYLGAPHGTRLILSSLKETWDKDLIRGLGRELWRLRSPFSLEGKKETGPSRFEIELVAPNIEDAKKEFDEAISVLVSNWKARIRGNLEGGRRDGSCTITVEFRDDYPDRCAKEAYRLKARLPVKTRSGMPKKPMLDKVSFDIMIFKLEGRQKGHSVGDVRKYLEEFGNVSVYDTGFRLPYYGQGASPAGQDWLSISVDHSRRISVSDLLPESLRLNERYMLDLPATGRILGSVDVNTNHEAQVAATVSAAPDEWLQIQPGRDRLSANHAFDQLHDLVRLGLDFYANRYRLRVIEAPEPPRSEQAPERYAVAISVLDQSEADIPARVYNEVRKEISAARLIAKRQSDDVDRRAAMLAPLATAGMGALALSHELSREFRVLDSIGSKLNSVARSLGRDDLQKLATQFKGARVRLAALLELFAPLMSEEDAKATQRLLVKPLTQQCIDSMKVLMPGVEFDLGAIPRDLRFPMGAWAEWNALLQNVFSNSWNAMLNSRTSKIKLEGGRTSRGREWVRISNTGQGLAVPLEESEDLFSAFERRLQVPEDQRSLMIGGKGLGLAIVRMIARRRGADVTFVLPEEGYGTALELSWSGGKS